APCPYTTLFRSHRAALSVPREGAGSVAAAPLCQRQAGGLVPGGAQEPGRLVLQPAPLPALHARGPDAVLCGARGLGFTRGRVLQGALRAAAASRRPGARPRPY